MLRLPEIFAFICMVQHVCQKEKPTKLKVQVTFVIHLIFTSIFLLLEGERNRKDSQMNATEDR